MNFLIINTGRFGDIIQSAPLLKALKKKYKKCKIFYLVLENFKPAAELINEIDEIISINFSNVLKEIDNNLNDEAFFELKRIFSNIKVDFDSVINLSFSELSAIISSIVKGKDKRGFTLTDKNEFITIDNWSKFFLAIVNYREYSPFNLVDIFSKIAGVNSEKIFIEHKKSIKNIGFQLGASTENRRWPVKYFALLAKIILNKRDTQIYLFGSKNEINLGEEFLSHFKSERIINLIGKTSLKELNKKIKEIDMLITNDTGTMHLAWFSKKRVIELSLGPALYNTTGPYGNGHTIFQPDIHCVPCSYQVNCPHLKCLHLIKPEHIYSYLFENRILEGDYKIFQTDYDNDGFLNCIKIYGKDDKFSLYRENLKEIWINLIENNNLEIQENEKFVELNEIINQIFKHIEFIYKESNYNKIYDLWSRISELEEILKNSILSNYVNFIPFFKYFEFLKNFNVENDFYKLIEIYKNALIKLKYAINNFS